MIKLNSSINTVSKIIHAGDIHIRNLKRHTEYKIQFQKFYEKIKQIKDDSTIIYIAGDVVHTKTDMSPELIDMVSDFFISLADIAPTVVIAGNHDANLNNPDRLDALSPIIANLQHPNIFYLKDTGLYELGDIVFSVMSVFDEKEKYILASDIQTNKKKIALFHGPITNSVTGVGFQIQGHVDIDLFTGFDYALAGDIHQLQYLNAEKTIAYCSSLIQQNYGETYDNHGFLLWDLINKTSSFYHLDNEYGFHTLHIHKDELVPYNRGIITQNSRVRLKVTDSTDVYIRDESAKIKKELGISDLPINKAETVSINSNIDLIKSNTINVRNIETQNSLIRDFLNLTLNLSLPDGILDKVYEINKKTNLLLSDKDEIIRNVIWKPKKFEFSNMFSYGENNLIDFSSLRGIQGLFGPNASGKSSLLDALCFCLFDTTSRAYKADQIINTKKDWFSCKFNFEIAGTDYFIEKRGTKTSSGKVKVNIDFWCEGDNGDRKNLNGEQRRDTNSIIKSYIGSYEDFTLMCLSMQNNNTNFVDKSQTERKEILAKFLDLNIFESLYALANTEYRRIQAILENANSKEIELQINDLKDSISKKTFDYDTLNSNIILLDTEIASKNNDVLELSKQIQNVKTIDIDAAKKMEVQIQDNISKLEESVKFNNQLFSKTKKELQQIDLQLSNIDVNKMLEAEKEFEFNKSKLKALNSKLEKLKIITANKSDKLKKLEEHEYDPNCTYCINNVFVKDALQTKKELESDLKELTICQEDLRLTENIVNSFNSYHETKRKYETLNSKRNLVFIDSQGTNIKVLSEDKELSATKIELQKIQLLIREYYENESIILNNNTITEQIESVKSKIKSLQSETRLLNADLLQLYSDIKVAESKIDNLTEKLEKTNALLKEKAAYEYYLMAMEKDGISYQLMSRILPKIENEINSILSNLVDFKIILNTDGKNINAYIVYDNLYWPLELSSGMERFISSIAIRVGLINISSLPKPTFFAIDEGLGVLDSNNLNQIYLLFNYIRDIFNFTLIISHIDMVRDMVDHNITIESKNGFSKIDLT
jgi:DNA repair exonuclease SbcCD ATPase subunit